MAIAKKKKRFYQVDIPLIKKTTDLIAFEIKELDKRIIIYDLTRMLKGKSTLAQFQVEASEESAIAKPRMLKLLPCYLKRMVRKGTNYVEDSFTTKTKDKDVLIKPFLITRRKVSRAVRKALRVKAKEELEKTLAGKTVDEIFEEILRNKLQKELSLKLKKIYPLSLCEIRVLKVQNENGN